MSDSGGGAFIVLILIIVIVIALVIGFVTEALARRHRHVVVPLSRDEVIARANGWFGRIAWVDADGPGEINKRRRTASARRTYTISISVDDVGGHHSETEIWLSAAERAFAGLLVNAAGPAFQLARLQHRMAALGERSTVGNAEGATNSNRLLD